PAVPGHRRDGRRGRHRPPQFGALPAARRGRPARVRGDGAEPAVRGVFAGAGAAVAHWGREGFGVRSCQAALGARLWRGRGTGDSVETQLINQHDVAESGSGLVMIQARGRRTRVLLRMPSQLDPGTTWDRGWRTSYRTTTSCSTRRRWAGRAAGVLV